MRMTENGMIEPKDAMSKYLQNQERIGELEAELAPLKTENAKLHPLILKFLGPAPAIPATMPAAAPVAKPARAKKAAASKSAPAQASESKHEAKEIKETKDKGKAGRPVGAVYLKTVDHLREVDGPVSVADMAAHIGVERGKVSKAFKLAVKNNIARLVSFGVYERLPAKNGVEAR